MLASLLVPVLLSVLPPHPHHEAAREHAFDVPTQFHVPRSSPRSVPPLPSREVFGFVPYWVKQDPNTFRWETLTHVIYFAAHLSEIGEVENTFGWFDKDGNVPLVEIAHRNGRKALISAYVPRDLSGLLRRPERRVTAVASLVDLVLRSNADGLDIDFEPVRNDRTEDMITFMTMLSTELRARAPNAMLTMDVYAWPPFYPGYDIPRLAPLVDRLLVMGYNYHWKGGPQAGPNSPLTGSPRDWKLFVERSIGSVDGYLALAPRSKLILGVPYYGHDWPVVDPNVVPAVTSGVGFTRYYSDTAAQSRGRRQWDPVSQTPYYAYSDANGPRHVWYEDEESLLLKYQYVNRTGLPGVMIWALGYDEGYAGLWDALARAFPPGAAPPPPDDEVPPPTEGGGDEGSEEEPPPGGVLPGDDGLGSEETPAELSTPPSPADGGGANGPGETDPLTESGEAATGSRTKSGCSSSTGALGAALLWVLVPTLLRRRRGASYIRAVRQGG